jgi:hypothetical protein
MMFTILALLGGLLSACGTIPYILETLKGRTKPRLVTWATWSTLTGVAAAGAFADGQIASGIFALLGSLSTGFIVVAGLRYGDRSFAKLDILCLMGVIAGLGLWLMLDSPAIAIWAAIAIDFVGFVPTFIHAWQKPHEETASTFVIVALGAAVTVGAIVSSGAHSVTAIGYPLYVTVSMGGCAAVILTRRSSTAAAVTSIES